MLDSVEEVKLLYGDLYNLLSDDNNDRIVRYCAALTCFLVAKEILSEGELEHMKSVSILTTTPESSGDE